MSGARLSLRCVLPIVLLSQVEAGVAQSISPITVPQSSPPRMIQIPSGRFAQSLGVAPAPGKLSVEKESPIASFFIDRLPVTNSQFLEFVKQHPRWQRHRAPKLLVDDSYLSDWQGSLMLGPRAAPNKPVTQVSWFAAKAYCEARGARLPTEEEWEYVAAASETAHDARQDPIWRRRILDWYAAPTKQVLPDVGQSPPNLYGVVDLHGLIWEWVLDFGSTMMSGDSRDSGGSDRMLFCGAAAVGAGEKQDYASFMRYAFRSSLRARYGSRNLGFRCAATSILQEREGIP